MAQQAKAPAAKPEDLVQSLESTWRKERAGSCRLSLDISVHILPLNKCNENPLKA